MPSFYNLGTATVAAGGTAVTGQGTAWLDTVRPGDLWGTHKGAGVRIASVNSNTSLTLAYAWTGGAQTTAAYEIQFTPYLTNPQQDLQALINLLGSGVNYALGGLSGAGGNKIPRLTGPGTADTIDSTNLAALAGLAGVADRFPYFTGAGAMALNPITAFMRTMMSATQIDGALSALGGGAVGVPAFKATNVAAFLTAAGILHALGNIADDAVASITMGSGAGQQGDFLLVATNTASRSGIFGVRTAATSTQIIPVSTINGINYATASSPPTGTTGVDGGFNVFAGNDRKVYFENRVGSALPVYAWKLTS